MEPDADPDADPGVVLARLLAERVIARLGRGAPPLRGRRVERVEFDQVLVEPLDADVLGGVACLVCARRTRPPHRADPAR